MKLPALWMLAAFAVGTGIAERWPGALKLWAVAALAAMAVGAALVILAGAGAARRYFVSFAWVCALAAWLALGGLASAVEVAGIPSNQITRLIAAGRIDTSVPLRWRGRLREDPWRCRGASGLKLIWSRWKRAARNCRSAAVCG